MSTALPVTEFLKKARHTPIIDVRTPAEYAQGHIPQAFNIPLFTNEQRAVVGTLYVQQSRNDAVFKGLEFVGPMMKDFALRAQTIAQEAGGKDLLVHCWRGGMRSASMAWLFEQVGLHCHTLEKGYKAYRTHVLEFFQSLPFEFHVLGGLTGSGKTEQLMEMRSKGTQFIDLEGIAHHKGSAFGALGQEAQPSTEHFENLLYEAFSHMDPLQPVWLEDESRNVGKCSIPAPLWEKMQTATFHLLERPYEERVKRLMNEYAGFNSEALCTSIQKIEKRLGYDQCRQALDAVRGGDIESALRICLNYYDKAYRFQIETRGYTTNNGQ